MLQEVLWLEEPRPHREASSHPVAKMKTVGAAWAG